MERTGRGLFSCLFWNLAVATAAVIESPLLQPYFVNTDQLEVNATSGKTAYLRCRVRHLGSNTVVWLRERDLHILTYDVYTYTSEDQFESHHSADSDEWTLMIRHPQMKDSGTYACQVSSEPYISQYYKLNIFTPRTKILAGSEQYFTAGSDVSLTCVVVDVLKTNEEVFWLKGDDIINNSINDAINIVTDRYTGRSQLVVSGAQLQDSGNYSCFVTSNDVYTVLVSVQDEPLDEENGVS